MTLAREPDFARYAQVRWQLTKASRARRTIIERCVKALAGIATPADMAVIARLRAADIEAVRRSSEHIYRWTPEEVKRDWFGYRQASHLVRAAMRARLREEETTLFPLLRRY